MSSERPNIKTSLEDYSSTVALNNMGISLLERRCYGEALDIFRDALTILRRSVTIESYPCEKSSQQLSLSQVEHKLYRASLHLRCEADGEPPVLVPCHLEESESEFEDESLSESFSVLNQNGEDMSFSHIDTISVFSAKHCIFYLDRTNDERPVDSQKIAAAYALILHNQGVTHRCLAHLHQADNKARTDALLESSAKYFHVSRSVLAGLDHPPSPIVAAAIHQTKLEVESGLGLNSAHNSSKSQVELEDDTVPTAARRKQSPSVSLSSMNDEELLKLISSSMAA